jgi:hypothetical protein
LQAKGFPTKCNKWIKEILSLGTSTILLNGVPHKDFECERGVKQGDPLLPHLLAAGLLQSISNKACQQGHLGIPIPRMDIEKFPIIQSVDDTLLFMQADAKQLFCLLKLFYTPLTETLG